MPAALSTAVRGPLLVNVGCGSVAHPEWANFDVAPRLPHVRQLDVRQGLPLADGQADAVYSSHVLEHLSSAEADGFLRELWRVLAPGGVIRLVVPDLEAICRLYLQELDALRAGAKADDFAYRFALLELLDQSVRDHSGGEMLQAYRGARGAAIDHVLRRHGAEAAPFVDDGRRAPPVPGTHGGAAGAGWRQRLQALRWRALLAGARLLAGDSAVQWLQVGRFRLSGEVHRVMYDSHSLAMLLQRHGFVDARVTSAGHSAIAAFARYALDTGADGTVRKPDSLFLEARKAA